MVDLVAKRYVKAIMIDSDNKSLTTMFNELNTISNAFLSDKFTSIIKSTDITVDAKVDLMLSFLKRSSKKTTNLIKLLGEKKRLDIIPDIVNILENELAVLNNSYTGIIHTNVKLSAQEVTKLNKQFSAKFDVTLKLTQNVCKYDGIKVDIDGLGIEVGFSKDRLKAQLIEHILKAV
ncbi:MAG: F0F1 ATP synthase subunit delta [Campylobacterota bacterium]|nr:F0F1 ATP synthase subunit delta [Campylobacterota bacterium]